MAGLVKGIKGGIKRFFGSQDDDAAEEANDVGSPTLLLQTVCKLPASFLKVLQAPCFLHMTLTPCPLSSTMRTHPNFLNTFGARRPPHHNELPRR